MDESILTNLVFFVIELVYDSSLERRGMEGGCLYLASSCVH